MARPISDEELQLKKRARRRLVGAIAVVTVVAVGLPMVLDHDPKPVSQEIKIQIPSPDSGEFKSKVVPVQPDAKPAAKPPLKSEAPPPPTLEKPAPEAVKPPVAEVAPKPAPAEPKKEAPKPVAKDPPKPAPKEPPKPAPRETPKPAAAEPAKPAPAAPASEAFSVQVAALADADKVKQLQDAITKAGLKSYTEVVAIAKGNVTRVRVGPYPSRDAAEKAREQLKGIGLDGKVVPK